MKRVRVRVAVCAVQQLLVGAYGGTPNPATFPQTMLVDWVRIRQ